MPATSACFRRAPPTRLRRLPERSRFFKGLASWIGFRQIRVDYEPAERIHGSTTWSLRGLIGLSIEGLTSFSVAPLRFASLLGLLLAASAFLFGLSMLFEAVFYGVEVPGYPSVVVGIMVIGGVQLVMIGVLGEYIGKILSEIKARPVYFVAEHSIKSAQAIRPAPRRRGRRRNEREAGAHLAVRRRLRHFSFGQFGDPRSHRARAAQRHLRDGGGAEFPAAPRPIRSTPSTPARGARRSGCM